MPTRTEVIITIGEVLECLPPGKSYRRKRYNSFDANQALAAGNEENVAPLGGAVVKCDITSSGMKARENGLLETELEPKVLTVRRKTRGSEDGSRKSTAEAGEDDDEVSFNPDTVSAIVENGNSLSNGDESAAKTKSKRKSSAEKFLEDNVSYFQLEVLASKTRSSKQFEPNGVVTDKETIGFHNSFLDFLKSKGVEGKEKDATERSRSRHKSGPTGGASKQSRQRTSSCHQSPHRSESEDSFRLPRSGSQYSKTRSRDVHRSRSRDFSPHESDAENEKTEIKHRKIKPSPKTHDSSDDESASEGTPVKSKRSRSKAEPMSSPSPGKRSRRSELDKLLEAVDTSFHFETAAAAAKRIGGSAGGELGPLEIDVSDSNQDSGEDEAVPQPSSGKKRKHTESEAEPERKPKKKKKMNSGDLLKTFSPTPPVVKAPVKEPTDSEEEEVMDTQETKPVWDGWESLNETLAGTSSAPMRLEDLHFSFEVAPVRESWFQTYSRQDLGEDVVFYPESKSFPFYLPFELPYSTFMPYKPEVKVEEKPKKRGPKKREETEEIPEKKGKLKKDPVSESESTDSENNKKAKLKFGPKTDHLLDLHPRISPRCHASTKVKSAAILHGGTLTDEELAEALLIQDERELHFPSYLPFFGQDETSNDSMSSTNTRHFKRENTADFQQIALSMDRFLRNTQGLTETDMTALISSPKSGKDRASADKVTVPTRSRISSEELLKNLKDKPKKKKEKVHSAEVIMDQVVAENVDGILLDCLEDELPTIPFESSSSETLSLLETYQACNSMNVCNSRWLRPSRPSFIGSPKDGAPSTAEKRTPFNLNKPKRLVIYKEDLPGFKYDNDMETEKLPVSKRILAKSAKKDEVEEEESAPPPQKDKPKSTKKVIRKEVFIARKEKMKEEVKEEPVDDNASETSENSSSRKKGKKKSNKTGFPTLKKKKKAPGVVEHLNQMKQEGNSKEKKKSKVSSPGSSSKKVEKIEKVEKVEKVEKTEKGEKGPVKKKIVKQLKMDKFITKRSSPKSIAQKGSSFRPGTSDLGRRSTTLQSKNYSELESDTESLFESKVPYRSPHMKMLKEKPANKSKSKSK